MTLHTPTGCAAYWPLCSLALRVTNDTVPAIEEATTVIATYGVPTQIEIQDDARFY